MMLPTIHSNGTGRETLISDLIDARGPLYDAIQKLETTGPNGRDYYPQGPDALRAAQVEHNARVEKLRSVYDELGELAQQIDQIGR